MSDAEGVVRMDTLGPDPLRATRFTAMPPLGAVSPELALVDADLARELRARLPEPAEPSRQPIATVSPSSPLVRTPRPALEAEPRQPARDRSRRSGKVRVLGLVALGALLTVVVRSESKPFALDRLSGEADPTALAQTPAQPVPAADGSTPMAKDFVWAAEPGAAAYEFQLFRGDTRVYRARVAAPRVVVPGRWRQGTRTDGLTAGGYRWYVWPISARTGNRATVATVQATLVVTEPGR